MAYAMTHMIIAYDYAKAMGIKDIGLFMLGSLAPDAVHSRSDFEFALKSDSHYFIPRDMWGKISTEEEMLVWYDNLSKCFPQIVARVKTEAEDTFLKGYFLHLMVDVFNCKLLYGKALIRYNYQVDQMREVYRRECIMQDQFLFLNWENREEAFNLIEEASRREEIGSILTNLGLNQHITHKNMIDSIAFTWNSYSGCEEVSLEGLDIITEEDTYEFLRIVTEEAKRLLFDYPDPARTFRMDG